MTENARRWSGTSGTCAASLAAPDDIVAAPNNRTHVASAALRRTVTGPPIRCSDLERGDVRNLLGALALEFGSEAVDGFRRELFAGLHGTPCGHGVVAPGRHLLVRNANESDGVLAR